MDSPDAFGLRAFDVSRPLTCMLPGSSPNELRLMIPDWGIAPEGFHDVVIENLAASPTWRSRHISPGMSLRSADGGRRLCFRPCGGVQRMWSGSVGFLVVVWSGSFGTISQDFALCVRRKLPLPWTYIMMNVHLELGQLWRCPVEWCTVWKGSVSDCLGHLQNKHGGSQYMATKNLLGLYPGIFG